MKENRDLLKRKNISPFSIGVFLRAGGKFRAVFFTEHAQLKKIWYSAEKKIIISS